MQLGIPFDIPRIDTDTLIEPVNMLVFCEKETEFALKDREITTLHNPDEVEHFERYWDSTHGSIIRTPHIYDFSSQIKKDFRYIVVHHNINPSVLYQVYKEYFYIIPNFMMFCECIENVKPGIIGIDCTKRGHNMEDVLFWLPL